MQVDVISDIYKMYKSAGVNQTIHPNDVMYRSGKNWYFPVGESGVQCVLAGLAHTTLPKVKRILDLPCGHGRVARHLAAAFPEAQFFFSDLDREGVDFCASSFNGKAVYSQPDLTTADIPGSLDVIWIGSLFTHLSKNKTSSWLEFLASKLTAHGIIVASFHGYFTVTNPPASSRVDIVKLRRQFSEEGYGFESYNADDPVQLGDYGFSVSKPSCVMDIVTAIPGTRVASYTERGWSANHDVLVLCRDDRLRPFNI